MKFYPSYDFYPFYRDTTVKTIGFDGDYYDESSLSRYGLYLPDYLRKSVCKRKVEYLAGRYCAAQALKEETGSFLQVGSDEKFVPIWPTGCLGSISHTHGYAVAIISTHQRWLSLGIDVQIICDYNDSRTIDMMSKYIADEEEIFLLKQYSLFPQPGFSLLFSAKESLFKSLYPYVRRYFGFKSAKLTAICQHKKSWSLVLRERLACFPEGSLFTGSFHQADKLVQTCLAFKEGEWLHAK